MPRLAYSTKRFAPETLDAIAVANEILHEYAEQGFDLTLRQLYYQHVARGLIPNTDRSYKRLGSIVNDARLAGYIDWDFIVDRTRNLAALAHWESPAEIIAATVKSYRRDLWADQPTYVEVWIEKDALVGVIEPTCQEFDVPYLSCRGYTSQSEMWSASQRLLERIVEHDQDVLILHLGDHDPSGIDMTRDIGVRLWTFIAYDYARAMNGGTLRGLSAANLDATARQGAGRLSVRRIALTMDQVEEYGPPPNPAKVTDSRAREYIANYGRESWELDALEPRVMAALIREHVEGELDGERWAAAVAREREGQGLLRRAHRGWDRIAESLRINDEEERDD